MKKDIKNLFNEKDNSKLELPENHRQEFLKKLESTKFQHSKKTKKSYWYQIAATIILCISIGIASTNLLNKEPQELTNKESLVEKEIKTIEESYYTTINNEWKTFLTLTKDERLIERYQKQLYDLDLEYKQHHKLFKNNNNNASAIEALIKNLQTRLELIKNIQTHIKLLNKQKVENETITI